MRLWEPSGCCCFNLRVGCLILGSLSLGGSILSLLVIIKTLITNDMDADIKDICSDEEIKNDLDDCEGLVKKIMISVLSTRFVMDTIQLIFSSLLIHGIRKDKSRMMIPYMVLLLIAISILMLTALGLMLFFIVVNLWQVVFVIAIVFGAIIFLETYFLLVLRAYHLEIKRSKARSHTILREEEESGSPQEEKMYPVLPEYHQPPPYSPY